ncbi:MAG: hypothetical protein ACOCP8_00490 [archaeon]
MVKKCSICQDEAKYFLPHADIYYCQECADDLFADLEHLKKISDEAEKLKDAINKKINLKED